MNPGLLVVPLLLALVACGGGESDSGDRASPTKESAAIEEAARAYSDAFLTGDGDSAYDLLSTRCQDRTPRAEFTAMVIAAGEQYGTALAFKSFSAEVNDQQARVTYTYDVAEINQTDEPWVKEDGSWHEDDC